MLVALAAAAAGRTVTFEPPVTVGHSVGVAVNASCGQGRFWFPQSGFALDDSGGTLVVEVSQGADTHDRRCARQMPLGVVFTSVDAGRSWAPAWFVDPHMTSWRGLGAGPTFCGSSGLMLPGGAGLVCPGEPVRPAYVDHNRIGVLELNASVWSRAPDARHPTVRPSPKQIVLTCPKGSGIPVGSFYGGPAPVAAPGGGLLRLVTCCSEGCESPTPTSTLVILRSDDGGWVWGPVSIVPRWAPLYTAGWYPRDCEIALGVVDNASLLIVNRVTTDVEGAQHKYVNYTMLWSPDLGASWQRWGPQKNVSRAMAGQWSVRPKIAPLPGGELMLTGGRPGIFLWIGGRDEGTRWQRVNLCAEHNAGLAPAQRAALGYETALATLPANAAPVPNAQDGMCCTHPNCSDNGAWCMSTGYNSIIPLDATGTEFVVVYDRLANGWGGPPGQWGPEDRVFSMRFSLRDDAHA